MSAIIRCMLLLGALLAPDASPASAQNAPCDASQFDALTNMWKREPDQNTGQVPAAELAAERRVMARVVEMFTSAFVPTGAAGYYGVNYDILPQARTNKSRYGNTYIFTLSNQKIECRGGKPRTGSCCRGPTPRGSRSSTSSMARRSGGSPGAAPCPFDTSPGASS
jgi:hypothetical protein